MLAPVISSLSANAATRFGPRAAIAIPGVGDYSFAALDVSIGRLAGGLARLGVGRGERVVLHLPNGWAWITAYHAIARLGAVVVPANIMLSATEVAFLISDSEAICLIAPVERGPSLSQAGATAAVVLDVDGAHGSAALDRWNGPPPAPARVDPDSLFTIGYTSGTTGKPKGAMLSHRNIFSSLAGAATLHVRHPQDVLLSSLPFAHVYGNVVMNSVFLTGARLVAPPRFDPGAALQLIEQERVTLFEGVPTMYYQMLSHERLETTDFSSLTRCTVGGQTMPDASIDEVSDRFGCPLIELWGMTEIGGPGITHSPYWPPRHGSIGLPVPGLEIKLTALQGASEMAAGEAGELAVRGDLVMSGYWRDPAATAEVFDADGWFATGDVARMDRDGRLFIVDRKKDVIITAGFNVYPAELEQVLAAHPAVAMTAVASMPDPEKGELAVAYIVLRPNAQVTAAELEAHCRDTLASYKIPRRFIIMNDLPKTSTGKIMRRALRTTLATVEESFT